MSPSRPLGVYIEEGKRRVFACAVDWPGWCRAAKDEDRAIEALLAYAPRYGLVCHQAGVTFGVNTRQKVEVLERLVGGATTDFGAPEKVASADGTPLGAKQLEAQLAILAAAWKMFDRTTARAPASLRKGPRGGGRDRDAIVAHVVGAESAYARKVGVRMKAPEHGDSKATADLRDAITSTIRSAARGSQSEENRWPLRYALRRVVWHVLDHMWEIEDRSV